MDNKKSFKAAVLDQINKPLKVEKLYIPELLESQVLVQIYFTTICGSQIFEIFGQRGRDKYLPHLLGHEGFGIVRAYGKKVTRFSIGDEVVLTWVKQKGENSKNCKYISESGKLINSGKISTFSEYAVISEDCIFQAPKGVQKNILPLLGCAALTGSGMVFEAPFNPKRALVVGAGGVGFFSILCLTDVGCSEIHVVDSNPDRLRLIKKLFPHTKTYDSFKNLRYLREIRYNGNFNLIFESTGQAQIIESSFSQLDKLGFLVFSSHPEHEKKIKISPYSLIEGRTIKGTWGGGCTNLDRKRLVTKMFVRHQELISKIVSRPFSLDDVNDAILNTRKGKHIKCLIDLNL